VEVLPVTLSRPETAGRLIGALGNRPVADLLPWLPVMNTHGRAGVANLLTGDAYWLPEAIRKRGLTAEFRPVVISLLSDRSPRVRGIAVKALTKTSLPPPEAGAVEALLTPAATDIRRGALTMLASLPPDAAQASAARLAASKDNRQRDAAVELFREIGAKPRNGAVGDPRPVQSPIENLHSALAAGHTRLAQPRRPKQRRRPDGRAANVLTALGEIAARHRDVPVAISSWQGSREMLFGDVQHFPAPFGNPLQTARVWAGVGAGTRMPGGTPAKTGERVLGEAFREYWACRTALRRRRARRAACLRPGGDIGGAAVGRFGSGHAGGRARGPRRRLVAGRPAAAGRHPTEGGTSPQRRPACHGLPGRRVRQRHGYRRVPGRAQDHVRDRSP
jgi:hypothetical protein